MGKEIIILPKHAWEKKKDYIYNTYYWYCICDIENIGEYNVEFDSPDIEFWDVFDAMDGTEMTEFRTGKEPQKDVKIILTPYTETD